jgi:DNA-binding LytR/AlgR family response regulator
MAPTQILIIEDDKVIAFDLKFSLEALGYAVCGIASNYEEAVKQALNSSPDLAMMDIHIKGSRTGIDTSRTFLENFDIPVIFLTSSIESSVVAKAIETEPMGYLVKPVRKDELKTNIELALANHARNKKVKSELGNISSAMHNIENPIIVTTAIGDITYINKSAENFCECLIHEWKDKSIRDFLHLTKEELNSLFAQISASAIGAAEIPQGAFIKLKKDKNIIIAGTASSFSDSEGKEEGFLFSLKNRDDNAKKPEEPGKDTSYMADGYVFIKDKGQMFRVNFEEIIYIEALGDYVMVHSKSKRYTTLMTMKKLEQMLPTDNFARVHRSYIVAIDKITSINGNDFDLQAGDKRIPIGETYKQELLKKIKVL